MELVYFVAEVFMATRKKLSYFHTRENFLITYLRIKKIKMKQTLHCIADILKKRNISGRASFFLGWARSGQEKSFESFNIQKIDNETDFLFFLNNFLIIVLIFSSFRKNFWWPWPTRSPH